MALTDPIAARLDEADQEAFHVLAQQEDRKPGAMLRILVREALAQRAAIAAIGSKHHLLLREDFDLQLEHAAKSVARGHYATARADLRGAIMLLENVEAREERAAPPAS